MVDAGRLDRRIVIQTCTTTQGAAGGVAEAWTTDATVWAQKVETTGSEAKRAGALRAETDLLLRIRYRQGLSEDQRVYFDGRYYDIIAITELDRRDGQMIQCRYTEGAT